MNKEKELKDKKKLFKKEIKQQKLKLNNSIDEARKVIQKEKMEWEREKAAIVKEK